MTPYGRGFRPLRPSFSPRTRSPCPCRRSQMTGLPDRISNRRGISSTRAARGRASNWHRRAGKDSFALNSTAVAPRDVLETTGTCSLSRPRPGKALWDGTSPHTGERLIDQCFPDAMVETRRENEMMMRFRNGSTWRLVGSDNYDQLVGSTPAGIVFSEWALADPMADGFLRPILAASDGWPSISARHGAAITSARHMRQRYRTLGDALRRH
jgi:hypothetical protein